MEDKVDSLMSDFGARIDAIKKISSGKTALVGMTTSGSFNLLGNDGRCSLIGVEAGLTILQLQAQHQHTAMKLHLKQ